MDHKLISVHTFTKSLKDVDWGAPLSTAVELPKDFDELCKRELKETGNKLFCCFDMIMSEDRAKREIDRIRQFCSINSLTVSRIGSGSILINPYDGTKVDNHRRNKVVITLVPCK